MVSISMFNDAFTVKVTIVHFHDSPAEADEQTRDPMKEWDWLEELERQINETWDRLEEIERELNETWDRLEELKRQRKERWDWLEELKRQRKERWDWPATNGWLMKGKVSKLEAHNRRFKQKLVKNKVHDKRFDKSKESKGSTLISTTKEWIALAFVLLICCMPGVQSKQRHLKGRGEYESVIEICQGQSIPLLADFPGRHITKSKVVKDDHLRLLQYDRGSVLHMDSRVTYHGPTAISINDATVGDSGSYNIHVHFGDDGSKWISFEVNVFETCPNKAEFYDPVIKYSLGAGALQYLPRTNEIVIGKETTFTLNVTIPVADPPVTCTVYSQGQSVSKTGSSSSRTYCLATCSIKPGDHHLADVWLIHPHMDPHLTLSIFSAITDNLDSEDRVAIDAPGKDKTKPTDRYRMEKTVLITVVVVGTCLLMLVVPTLVFVCLLYFKNHRYTTVHSNE